MPALSRRAFIATGTAGAAGVGLAACGAEADESDRDAGADGDLLTAAIQAETALGASAEGAIQGSSGADAALAKDISSASSDRLGTLDDALEGAPSEAEAAEQADHAPSLDGVKTAAEDAIAAYREAAALLSTEELRATALEQIAPVAAELAAVRSVLGEDPSPFAFVTGLDEKPFEAVESDSEETTSDETDTTSTTSTSTAAEEEG